MSYIDNEILERLIGTMVEGFARIEKKLVRRDGEQRLRHFTDIGLVEVVEVL